MRTQHLFSESSVYDICESGLSILQVNRAKFDTISLELSVWHFVNVLRAVKKKLLLCQFTAKRKKFVEIPVRLKINRLFLYGSVCERYQAV
jgi:hypothetical protein